MIETGDSFSRLSLEKSVELLGRQETPLAVGVVGALEEHVQPTGRFRGARLAYWWGSKREASGLWRPGDLQPPVINLPQLSCPIHLS